ISTIFISGERGPATAFDTRPVAETLNTSRSSSRGNVGRGCLLGRTPKSSSARKTSIDYRLDDGFQVVPELGDAIC
ncbi:unnamed protein product, partial [Musa textilis]